MTDYLQKAIEFCDGQSALAKRMNAVLGYQDTDSKRIRQGHVWNWLNRDGYVPARLAPIVEAATDGAVKREQLRPDVFQIPKPTPQPRRRKP